MKKILSALTALTMIISMSSIYSFAAEDTTEVTNTTEIVSEETTTEGITSENTAEEKSHMFGDTNGDGKVDSVDAYCILVFYAYNLVENPNNPYNLTLEEADINSDKKINSADASLILAYYAKWLVDKNIHSLKEYLNA